MAKLFLDVLYRVPGLQRGYGVAVPEIVEPDLWLADGGNDLLEVAEHCVVSNVASELIRKDQIVLVGP